MPTGAASVRELTESIDAEQLGLQVFWFTISTKWDLSIRNAFLLVNLDNASRQKVNFLT